MPEPSPLYRLADVLLEDEGGVAAYVAKLRGEGVSWRRIELALHDTYDIDVSYQTLRDWFPELVEAS